jgi:hypothetical protein
MTQQMQREAIALIAAAAVFARSVYPTPILGRAKEPYKNQVIARLCYALAGVFALLVWYGIYREGR